jgi:flagellin
MALGTIAFGDALRPATNIAAMTLLNQLSAVNQELTARQLRVATGLAQPRMEDGPSFFSLQNKMRNQVRGKAMALDNIGDAKDKLSVAQTGLLEIDKLLSQMRDLAVRGASDTLTAEQRDDINRELANIAWAIDQIAETTRFNESDPLLLGDKEVIQVGPNENDIEGIAFGTFDSDTLNIETADVNVSNNQNARLSIARIDAAINTVKDQLNDIGGYQRKFSALEAILSASMAAEESQASRFGDADVAREQTEIAKLQLMQQLVLANLAAANTTPTQIVSGLFGG